MDYKAEIKKKLLKEYKEKLDKDPENTVDIYEFSTKRVLYTGTAKAAYQVYVNENVDVEESVDVWNKKFQEAFDMDVADIKSKFPGKYDLSIQQAQECLDDIIKKVKS